MKRLALIAATGFLSLALTACGEHDSSKPVAGASDSTVVQPQDQNQAVPAQQPAPAAPDAPAEGQH